MKKIITLGTSHGDPMPNRFNTSTLYASKAAATTYLVDAGAPVQASIIRKNIDFSTLQAVFITHLHEDHYGGLSGILKHCIKYNYQLKVYFPEAKAISVFTELIDISHRSDVNNCIQYFVIEPGLFFQDENLTVQAIPTRHMQNENCNAPSYAFVLQNTNMRILHTGDLRSDFSDFPWTECSENTVCVCELTHFRLAPWIEKLAKLPLKKMIFTHIGEFYHRAEGLEQVKELHDKASYPCYIAEDGDEFTI